MACGDVLGRVIGAVFCRRYGRKMADYFQPWGQYGVAVSDGVEILAFAATLGFEEGCTILSYDGANALNSIYRHRFLPALAEIVPSVVPYASNLYTREPPKLLLALDGGGLEGFNDWGGRGYDDYVPEEVTKTAPSGDETT